MLEERKNLLNNMDQKERRGSRKKNSYAERAKETDVHIRRIPGDAPGERNYLALQRKSANEPL